MPRDSFLVATPGFIMDANSIVRRQGGVQIDWPNVPASFKDSVTGKKVIEAGTPVSEPTTVGQCVPRPPDGSKAAVGILETNAVEGDRSAAKTGYGLIIGGNVDPNRMPIPITATIKTELDAAGTGFALQPSTNSLAV